MYSIELKTYGFKLTFSDVMTKHQMQKWVEESKDILSKQKNEFCVMIDMRFVKPFPHETEDLLLEGQKLYKNAGMQRSVVIFNNPTITRQFKNYAKLSGIYKWERYVDASSSADWRKIAEDWLVHKIDPDKNS